MNINSTSESKNVQSSGMDTIPYVMHIFSFLDWRKKQKTTILGGTIMYDIKGHYKFLHENELFDFWSNRFCA